MDQRQRMFRHGPRTRALAVSISALIAAGGISSTAVGQEQDDSNNAQQDTIIVTGTRIRRDDFTAAQATTVITADDMKALGVVSVADMVNQLPNNIASVSPESTADSPFYLGASIANMRGLNTAYGVRTLTLLDSRRMTPTNNGGGVDMNFIPSALVGRIETVTGGASATYGADAMAGVVNVILDDNIENIRVDLNYQRTGEGDGDQYTLSFGTGFHFFENNRGNLTVGLDSSRQDAIEDCTTHALCQRGLGLFRNGEQNTSLNIASMYTLRTAGDGSDGNIIFRGQPEWVLQQGHRYTTTTSGVMMADPTIGGYPCATMANGVVDTSACTTLDDYNAGWYTLNDAGTDLVPYMTPDQVTPQQLAAVYSVGTQTGIGISYQGDGNRWSTPWGLGRSIYKDVPIIPRTDRDNLFLRFTYELEGGIKLGADLTYGNTRSETAQNSARNNLQQFCVMPNNAFLQPEMGSGQLLRDVFEARTGYGVSSGAFNPFGNDIGCRQAPFLGTVLRFRDTDELVSDPNRTDLPPGAVFDKDFGAQVDHRNINDSNATSLTLTANGSLFEGGSWTWDAYTQFGHTENRQTLSGWRAGRRWDMALDSVIEGYDTNGDGVVDVPTWNMPDPNDSTTWTQNAQPANSVPVVVCSIDSHNSVGLDSTSSNSTPGANLVNWGDVMRLKWQDYLSLAIDDELTAAELQQVYADLSTGCIPFNPFGTQPFTDQQTNYIFPTLYEGTDNDQTQLSLSFSGDAWKGIGNAGPMRMAAGIDWRQNDTQNYADKNRFLGADFNFIGTSSSNQSSRRIYGDNWFGRTETKEAWVEFDLPLLRDKVGADSLVFNTGFRRTENSTQRISGLSKVQARNDTRQIDSWKASMQWQPVDLMRVRMTRSADTRAPSANELYATNSYVIETSGQQEINNPWRFYVNGFSWENRDLINVLEAGNASLEAETSTTETLGLVFQPVDTVPGLQVSVDYYQTEVKGGIQEIDANDTVSACATEIGGNGRWGQIPFVPVEDQRYCPNILFGDPDPTQEFFAAGARPAPFQSLILGPDGVTPVADGTPNPYYPYTNIVSVAKSTINNEPITSRGIDYSISYFTQLGGGGSINARALITRFLEQKVFIGNTFGPIDVSGQTGGNNIANYFGTFSTNYSPTPRIRGNLYLTYSKNAFSMTAQARYTGAGKLSRQNNWLAPGDATWWTLYVNDAPSTDQNYPLYQPYDPDVERTVSDGETPGWVTLNLNFSYDFGRSRFQFDRFDSLSAYFNIENVGDRTPTFFSGTGAGGINSALFSALGRQYRLGIRMEF